MATHSIPCPSFDAGSDALQQWIQGLRREGIRHAAPALILALDRLRQSEIPPKHRLWLLRLLKAPLLKTCAGLPKPWGVGPGRSEVPGLSLEQRLYRLMFQNLELTLNQLDRSQFLPDDQETLRRDWIIRNLFRFFQRQIRYAALWEVPVPESAWRDLHELYVYLRMRQEPAVEGAPRPEVADDFLGLDLEYRQLLLFGLVASLNAAGARSGVLMAGLSRWARESLLEDPEAMQGERGLFLVEVSEDSPPRQHPGPLDRTFRGWVLVPPAAFVERLYETAKVQGRTRSG